MFRWLFGTAFPSLIPKEALRQVSVVNVDQDPWCFHQLQLATEDGVFAQHEVEASFQS